MDNPENGVNAPQRQAITSPLEQNALVLAGAGTGKTTVLTRRIAYLIKNGVRPHTIMAMTFTNKAAAEMRNRLTAMVGEETAKSVLTGTFHSIGRRILIKHGKSIKLHDKFVILDEGDCLSVVKRIFKQCNAADVEGEKPKDHLRWIHKWKDAGQFPEHTGPTFPANKEFCRTTIYPQYQSELRRVNAVDFSDLIMLPNYIFDLFPEVAQAVQRGFTHILADEFQDTSWEQYRLLGHLSRAGTQARVMAVGDDDQSIYGWRGATANVLQRFLKEYPGCEMHTLEQNYRCSPIILDAANAVIGGNAERLAKVLHTERTDGEAIQIYKARNRDAEAERVALEIAERLQKGASVNDFAVLYRNNALSRAIEKSLVLAGIPYKVYGSLSFFQRAEIKDALAYLRLVQNRHDNEAFWRAANVPSRAIGDKTLEKLSESAKHMESSLWQAASAVGGPVGQKLARFMNSVDQLAKAYDGNHLDQLMEALVNGIGLKEHYVEKEKETGETKCENLDELAQSAASFENKWRLGKSGIVNSLAVNHDDPLSEFLAEAVLDADIAERQSKLEDAVSLMSLHKAKGMEYADVFLIGLEDGTFPSARTEDMEEERRLFYVGITRAKHRLRISWAEMAGYGFSVIPQTESPFLKEIPEHLTHHARPQSTAVLRGDVAWQRKENMAHLKNHEEDGL